MTRWVRIDPAARRRHNGLVGGCGTARRALAAGALLLATALLAADYEIGPGDVLKIVVLGQAEMTGSFAVDPEGMLSFPVLGKIKASEHTSLDLERKITTLLADGILKRPQVTVTVAEYGSQKVFVAGEVQRPGQYALKADRSLLGLLGDIGPLGPGAGHEVIVVRPPLPAAAAPVGEPPSPAVSAPDDAVLFPADAQAAAARAADAESTAGEGTAPAEAEPPPAAGIPGLPFVAPGSEIFRVSLLELQSGNPEKNIALKAGDTVFFPRASQVYVMGSVGRPGPYRFEEGMTVMQALTLAGGATSRGSAGRTKVVRIVNGKKVEKKAKATDLVQPEDTLIVPERFF
jgi:polysaccharide biosynthesis/export protein